MTKIKEAIEKIVTPLIKIQTLRGKVTSIDKENDTCEIEPLSEEATYFDVRLKSVIAGTNTRHVVYPKIGSVVHISLIENNEADTYVSQISEFDSLLIENENLKLELSSKGKVILEAKELEINGGSLGGMIKVKELKTEVEKNSAFISALQNILSTWSPASGDGGAVLKGLTSTVITMPTANLSNIENTKIKHG